MAHDPGFVKRFYALCFVGMGVVAFGFAKLYADGERWVGIIGMIFIAVIAVWATVRVILDQRR